MSRFLGISLTSVALLVGLCVADAWARGGGGRGGGGGGMRGGGFSGGGGGGFSGGGGRPSPAARPATPSRPSGGNLGGNAGANRSPSMSRPDGASRAGNFGSGGAGTNRAGGERPSQRELNDFLNMPSGSRGAGAGATAGAAGGTRSGSKTVTGPNGGSVTVAGKGGAIAGPGGGGAAAGRWGMKVTGPGGNSYVKVGSAAGVRGPGGNTVAAGRGATFANGQFVGGKTWGAVNGNFNHWGYYGAGWHTGYPGCWWPGRWAVAGGIWAASSWANAGAYCGCSDTGMYYDYGQNVTYEDGSVYQDGEAVGTEEEYYNQATEIAQTGKEATNEDWLPLGVFALANDGDSNSDKVLQLAVNKDGVIRGNYHDIVTDKVTPLTGAVNKETQRVAIQLEGNDNVVIETGLYNLTNDEAPILLHLNKDRTVSRVLVRLKQPEEGAAQESNS